MAAQTPANGSNYNEHRPRPAARYHVDTGDNEQLTSLYVSTSGVFDSSPSRFRHPHADSLHAWEQADGEQESAKAQIYDEDAIEYACELIEQRWSDVEFDELTEPRCVQLDNTVTVFVSTASWDCRASWERIAPDEAKFEFKLRKQETNTEALAL